MIELKCPHCGHLLRVRSKYAGKQGQCKHCQGFVDVPNTYAADADQDARIVAADAPTTPINRLPNPEGGTALADLLGGDDAPASPPESTPAANPVEGTALDDLLAEPGEPGAMKPTVPMAPDALDDLAGAPAPLSIPHKRLGGLFWFLAIVLSPVALIWGLLLPKGHPQKKVAIVVPGIFICIGLLILIGIFVVLPLTLLSMFEGGSGAQPAGRLTIDPPVLNIEVSPDYTIVRAHRPTGVEYGVSWSSSDLSIANVVDSDDGAMVYGLSPGTATITAEVSTTGEQALATVIVSTGSVTADTSVSNYAETRLPSYPGLVFNPADHSENTLAGVLARANRSELSTFLGYTSTDFETVSEFFYQELQKRGWTIDDYGYGSMDGEAYIVGQDGSNGIVYRTRKVASRTRVVITYGPTH